MKKLILIFILTFVTTLITAQSTWTQPQNLGGPSTFVEAKGALKVPNGIIIGRFTDTFALNLTNSRFYEGVWADVAGEFYTRINNRWVKKTGLGSITPAILSDSLDRYIPLAGTRVGKPVTGDIRLSIGNAIVGDNVNLFGVDENYNLDDFQNGGVFTARRSPEYNTAELVAKRMDTIVALSAYRGATPLITNGVMLNAPSNSKGLKGSTYFPNKDSLTFAQMKDVKDSAARARFHADSLFATVSGGTTETASNGLTKVGNDIQLGGNLSSNVTINGLTSRTVTITNSSPSNPALLVTNTGAGQPFSVISGINSAINGSTTDNVNSTAYLTENTTATNSIKEILALRRSTTGATATNGIGSFISFKNQDNAGQVRATGKLYNEVTDVTAATLSSKLYFSNLDNALERISLTLNPNASIRANRYGTGLFTGTPTYALQVDASGNIIEGALSGGGGVTDHTLLSNIGTNTHAQIDTHIASTLNPHSVTKAQVGLANVDNTSDINKPISTATQTALNLKGDLASPNFTGTIGGVDINLTGNLRIAGDFRPNNDPGTPSYILKSNGAGTAPSWIPNVVDTLEANNSNLHALIKKYINDTVTVNTITIGFGLKKPLSNLYVDSLQITTRAKSQNDSSTIMTAVNAIGLTPKDELEEFSLIAQAMGSRIIAQKPGGLLYSNTTTIAPTDGRVLFLPIYIKRDTTLTGVGLYFNTQGVYTADNNNKVGLYSYNTTTGLMTRIAQSVNNGNLWKAAGGAFPKEAFSSTLAVTKGLYFVSVIYNNSAQTTAPLLLGQDNFNPSNLRYDFTNTATLLGYVTASDLPVTQAMSGLTLITSWPWYFVY